MFEVNPFLGQWCFYRQAPFGSVFIIFQAYAPFGSPLFLAHLRPPGP